ncbi:MAG TPA: pitrilysin family protein, partial [Burkholderiales bacterium]|nr:pitrilysin family protein [Burkholderiales bacterium]
DHRAPVAVSMVWYRVGSVDEVTGHTGVAHVLEHMMFKGTRDVGPGQFSRLVAAGGGRDNAFTSRDATAYFQTLQKSELPLALKLEADRMANLTLSADEFKREIQVVMEERRWRVDDQARSLLSEQMMATVFKAHPYRQPVIGWMNDLQNMTVEDARAFYERWYGPNNALLVVVGDVQPDEVFGLAKKYFGPLKSRALPERKPQVEPEQRGIQRITVKAPAELPSLVMTYRTPALVDPEHDWEPYALDVLSDVLAGNEAARLNRSLVRDQRIAGSAGAGYDSIGRGPALFQLFATPTPGRNVAELEQALRREIQSVVDKGVSAEELERVKAQSVASHVYERDSMMFQARQIGGLEIAGLSHRYIDLFLEKLKAVTPEQVQAVAKKYLVDDGLTVAFLDPQPLPAERPAPPPGGVDHVR